MLQKPNEMFLKTREAADIMRLSVKRVAELCESGQIAARRTGGNTGHWRIYRDQFMKELELPPDDPVPVHEREEVDMDVFNRIRAALKKQK